MDDTARVACCLICLVADRLKACQTCAFNIGLAVKADIEESRNSVFSQNDTTIEKEIKP